MIYRSYYSIMIDWTFNRTFIVPSFIDQTLSLLQPFFFFFFFFIQIICLNINLLKYKWVLTVAR
jgi:hypothetical protein